MKAIIRPETEMKESGIEWIGNIPRIWKIVYLKLLEVEQRQIQILRNIIKA